jgi:hypothetical protein
MKEIEHLIPLIESFLNFGGTLKMIESLWEFCKVSPYI